MEEDDLPTPDEILAIHEQLEEAYDLKHRGVMKAAPRLKLEREVLTPARTRDDLYQRAAVLLWELSSLHLFEDGNKRTAWTTTVEYLSRHNIETEHLGDEIVQVVRRIGLFSVEELATWLETGRIDTSRLPED
ncbi:Fic family protein [Haloglomus litoreum]|uniref:Fic family protein n=1 Tax=Haloglomus litoreum TaxID=3034026 RepID=UPI0023E766EA|nr:Fic family protein [Haloglomus sp. DT116]